MDKVKLDAIMRSVEQTSMKECEITTKNAKIKIVRKDARPIVKTDSKVLDKPVEVKKVVSEQKAEKEEVSDSNCVDITSNWVGYFYRGTDKDKKSLVKLRDVIKKGQQVGTIVTMNVSHAVVSQIDGKLTDVLVEDGQAVEFAQPLLRICK